MIICQITGSFPPDKCGVGDYTETLSKEIAKLKNYNVVVVTKKREGNSVIYQNDNISRLEVKPIVKSWSIFSIWKNFKKIWELNFDILNIQYPTVGYRFKLGVLLLAVYFRLYGKPIILTLHEFSNAHFLRKLHNLFLILLSTKVVVTTDLEKDKIVSCFFNSNNIKKKVSVIPIGSNINSFKKSKNIDWNQLVYFGMFYPGKNIEWLIEMMKELRNKGYQNYKLKLVGNIHEYHKDYFYRLKEIVENEALNESVEFIVGQSAEIVSEIIANSFVAILPFEDGVSLRRGSYLACASLGVPVISTHGLSTTDDFKNHHNIIFANNVDEIVNQLLFLAENKNLYFDIKEKTMLFSKNFSWESIAKKYKKIFEEVMR